MTAKPTITKISRDGGDKYTLYARLTNTGTSRLGGGWLIARLTRTDGTVKDEQLGNITELDPGETTKVSISTLEAATVELKQYVTYGGKQSYPIGHKIRRGMFGWSSAA